MGKEIWEMVAVYLMPPAAFSLAATYWLSRLGPRQMMTMEYPLALGAVMLGMGVTLIAAFLAAGKVKRRREG